MKSQAASLEILADPAWLPHRIDVASRAVEFAHWPRAAQQAATFLSDERAERPRVSLPLVRLTAVPASGGPLHFVFHSAFCCSTLLTRALDLPGTAMGLKEPPVLNDLATLRRQGLRAGALDEWLQPLLRLLARPLAAGEAVIVKPGNVANVLIDELLGACADSRVLLMSSSLPSFLRSIAAKGLWGRRWVRGLYALLRPDSPLDPGFDEAQVFQQSDLQIAALAWLMQRAQFVAVAKRFGPSRVRTLDAEVLLARTVPTLAAVGRHLDLAPLGATQEAAARAIFGQDAKAHERSFDRAARDQQHARAAQAHGEEIEMVRAWAGTVAAHVGLPMELPQPLPMAP